MLPLFSQTSLPEKPSPILIPLKNISTIKKIAALPGKGRVEAIGFNRDGSLLAMGGPNGIVLWNLNSGKTALLSFPTKFNSFPAEFDFSPDGKTLASVMGHEAIVLWDLSNLSSRLLEKSTIFNIAFSPDGNFFATGSNGQGVNLWDATRNKKIASFQKIKSASYSGIKFSPDGKYIAAIRNSESVVLLTSNNGAVIKTFSGHQPYLTSHAISPDGKLLVTGGDDKKIIIWEIDSGNKLREITGLPDRVNYLAFSPNGKFLAGALGPISLPWESLKPETSVMLLDLSSMEGPVINVPYCYALAFSPDGKIMATGSASGQELAILWDMRFVGIREKFKKDPFETTQEYESRMKSVEIDYSLSIDLPAEQYNADKGGFEITLMKNKLFVPVSRDIAKELVERQPGSLTLNGKLIYHDPENLELTEAVVKDAVQDQNYQVIKTGEVTEAPEKAPEKK
ncbi:MAG: WD40 repeat domain-containing protein [Candidatus Aminicenantes bacterium]|nr:WD40 repeat domain-containing protein [Candidatus Aminicenantes bacterium]